ncbi:MAG: ATP--guanido phosphotransferase [Lentisphaerae bacterium]|nr:ATP--guanido phosphotransferase [Lentisphaerota bacterium]
MRKLLQQRRRGAARVAPGEAIALSCRIRLARNIEGLRFHDWNDEAGHMAVVDRLVEAIRGTGCLPIARLIGGRDAPADAEEWSLLHEAHLVSKDLLDRGRGGALIQSTDPGVSIMLNEEDHLRIQVIRPGMDLRAAWAVADQLDTRLEAVLPYAFSPRLGYLTACPSNVGTGLRASVMVHLLGLRLSEDLEAVLRALDALHVTVRGVYGEGTEAAGHLFQISNQGTLGQREHEVVDTLLQQVEEVIRQEQAARLRLMRDSPVLLQDCVARALALLQHARMIPSDESMDYLSALRLGVQTGMLNNLTIRRIDELMIATQPAHLLATLHETAAESGQRDALRAAWLSEKLAPVSLSV